MEIKKIDPLAAALTNKGVAPDAIDGTSPTISSLSLAKGEHFATGVWECTPGRFPWNYARSETVHILAGSASFTPGDGEPVSFGAGDMLFFPAGTHGFWDVTETIRKVYAIF
jgi:uncharacterized protein